MSGYAEITYSSQFEKFNVQIHPIETHHQAELQEIERHIQACIRKVEYLNALLTGQTKLDDKIIIKKNASNHVLFHYTFIFSFSCNPVTDSNTSIDSPNVISKLSCPLCMETV